MPPTIDLTGQVFGKLTVIRRNGIIYPQAAWLCQCECGNTSTVRGQSLRIGDTTSCGCNNVARDLTGQTFGLLTVQSRAPNRDGNVMWACTCACGGSIDFRADRLLDKYMSSCGCRVGATHNMSGTSEYGIWINMRDRCNNPFNQNYHRYGGRGIYVCDSWDESFINFYADMGDRPEGMSIDRIDNNKGYSPDNCRWATNLQQSVNKNPIKGTVSGHRGVYRHGAKWRVTLMANGVKHVIGSYTDIDDAVAARRAGELKYFGEYCPTK